MLDVLCPLITESDSVSNNLLDTILINIVEPGKSTRKNAYLLAKELIVKCSDTLESYIQGVSFKIKLCIAISSLDIFVCSFSTKC
jgi:sister chromatid cohesion protein PDS5